MAEYTTDFDFLAGLIWLTELHRVGPLAGNPEIPAPGAPALPLYLLLLLPLDGLPLIEAPFAVEDLDDDLVVVGLVDGFFDVPLLDVPLLEAPDEADLPVEPLVLEVLNPTAAVLYDPLLDLAPPTP